MKGDYIFLCLYVDDILISRPNMGVNEDKAFLSKFDMNDLDEPIIYLVWDYENPVLSTPGINTTIWKMLEEV